MPERLKKLLIIAAIIVAMFIPLFIALISYAVVNARPDPVPVELYTAQITTPGGKTLTADSNTIEMLLSMKRDARHDFNGSVSDMYKFDVSFLCENSAEYVKFYFAKDGTGAIETVDKLLTVKKSQIEKFLATKYASELYDNSELPGFITLGNRRILPSSGSWNYTGYGNAKITQDIEFREELSVYEHTGKLGLSFTTTPSVCTVKIRYGDQTVYDGDYKNLYERAFDESRMLEYTVNAEWDGDGYSGSAYYHFYAKVSVPASFTVEGASDGAISVVLGDYIMITAENIGIPSDVGFTCEPSIGYTPVFYANGGLCYALVPFDMNLPPYDAADTDGLNYPVAYRLTFTYGEAVKSFTVNVSPKTQKIKDIDISRISVLYNSSAVAECDNLIRSVSSGAGEKTIYINGRFSAKYSDEMIYFGYGYTRRITTTGETYRQGGVEYSLPRGADVPAVNNGKVVKTGNCTMLGSYVVIDHGLGLMTWYCHLSEIDVAEGRTVVSGQTVGKAGNSGFTDNTGVYLMTTIGGICVSPYEFFERGLTLVGAKG